MNSTTYNIEKLFDLNPIKPGKISEISETTAASTVPAAERVNFHIGNPVQDDKLTYHYLRAALGLKTNGSHDFNLEELNAELGWENENSKRIKFLYDVIKISAPYSPRGGFSIKNPIPLIKKFHHWLSEDQEEPLSYDLGEKSGRRELVISSGGIDEALRILFHSLNSYLKNLPAKIFSIDYDFPEVTKNFANLDFETLSPNDQIAYLDLRKYLEANNDKPVYLVIGKVLSEEIRRKLRNICLKYPLYFIEVNDAHNYLSLAREAKLKNRVLRILTPGFLSEQLKDLSVVFVAGIAELLKIFESVHFQLKGTPSSSEIELLNYLMNNPDEIAEQNLSDDIAEPVSDSVIGKINLPDVGLDNQIKITENIVTSVENKVNKIVERAVNLTDKLSSSYFRNLIPSDHLINKGTDYILEEFFLNIGNAKWKADTVDSFVGAFVKEHPEYLLSNLTVVNGSSRTALGLLGFHCGFKEIVTCDYSWTYEHCFPKSKFIPLTDDFELDIEGMANQVDVCKSTNQSLCKIAVVVNNPHNASGKIFRESDLKNLVEKVLDKNVFIIDDLAYQNVLAENSLAGPKTIKQLALDLIKEGRIYKDQLSKIITIHSLSKTDSFAGARLASVEINDKELIEKFRKLNSLIKPNIAAILAAYLFYRSDTNQIKNFWLLRNKIFKDKMKALEDAASELPDARNHFNIRIQRPQGSMYPRMVIDRLPDGLSLDWLSSGLAAQGIGLVPLSSFARTSKGFELARKSFRLTLGGTDTADQLLRKTRRVLIDLNRLIAEEKAKYNKQIFAVKSVNSRSNQYLGSVKSLWNIFESDLKNTAKINSAKSINKFSGNSEGAFFEKRFVEKYLPERIETFKNIFSEQLKISNDFLSLISSEGNKVYTDQLEKEFYKDDLTKRSEAFRKRTYDRTVHPTQLYAVDTDIQFYAVIEKLLKNEKPSQKNISALSTILLNEYLGKNVAINSVKEGEELVCDLHSLISAEQYSSLYSNDHNNILLSFWGDWDGSTRPSGQGHRLVAAALIENVNQLSTIIKTLIEVDRSVKIEPSLFAQINQLNTSNKEFWELLNHITALTNQLEKRYKSILPTNIESNVLRKVGVKLGVAQDPLIKLWQHNDRLEKKMLEMRIERKNRLEYYFKLNKELRKTLFGLIPAISKNSNNQQLILKAGLYRDILKRFVLTPRIHQKLITAKDQFAINTTVHNIMEINEISGSFGNPGMVMGLQVSMSTNAESLISLDKKFVAERERVLKKNNSNEIPKVWSIPLFEDIDTVSGIETYLDKVWDYAIQSRSIDQNVKDRFSEIMCEVFIAGSDLSQQVGQTASAFQYNNAKHKLIEWLAKKGLVEDIRIKLGSGEPMQRQGGYYADFSSKPAFIKNEINDIRFAENLNESTIKSTEFAVSPLHGVFSGGDLRTLQSAISEKMRHLKTSDRAQLLFHLKKTQEFHHSELIRASEPFIDTRLVYESKSLNELERLTLGKSDDIFKSFTEFTQKNFQQIIYGNEDDVVGIHVISYFLSRATPILRDRPVERPSKGGGDNQGQKILERIASTIPLCKHGSLLRAIGHNKAQTFMLGVNQLTTGLFRAMNQFSQKEFVGGRGALFLNDRILPRLPVYEILFTLRMFQDYELKNLQKFSDAFPSGITPFTLLREDKDSSEIFIPLLQKELLRRHGINVAEFFKGDSFIPELLPTLRPDLAVLLQPDLFNIDIDKAVKGIHHKIPNEWLKEFSDLLVVPRKINGWRQRIWTLLEDPIKNQVKSFVELAIALNTLSKDIDTKEFSLSTPSRKSKIETSFTGLLRSNIDDSMRQFLSAAVQYLTRLPIENVEVPIDIVRALKDVERILQIEEQALSVKNQELLNFYLFQIARYVGDNG